MRYASTHRIQDIRPRSIAAAACMQANETIIGINGQFVYGRSDSDVLYSLAKALEKGGQAGEVEVTCMVADDAIRLIGPLHIPATTSQLRSSIAPSSPRVHRAHSTPEDMDVSLLSALSMPSFQLSRAQASSNSSEADPSRARGFETDDESDISALASPRTPIMPIARTTANFLHAPSMPASATALPPDATDDFRGTASSTSSSPLPFTWTAHTMSNVATTGGVSLAETVAKSRRHSTY